MKSLYDVILERVFSERTTTLLEGQNRYCFKVSPRANKVEIRQAVEAVFKVKVLGVNTMWVRGKGRVYGTTRGSTSAWKKAIVTVAPDQKIQIS